MSKQVAWMRLVSGQHSVDSHRTQMPIRRCQSQMQLTGILALMLKGWWKMPTGREWWFFLGSLANF
jgi:hypothetical protein